MSNCTCLHTLAKRRPGAVAARWDPTRTSSFVIAWNREIRIRLARVQQEIIVHVVKEDEYGLKPTIHVHARKYQFLTSAEKLAAFREWIADRMNYHMLYMVEGPTMLTHEDQWWANKYVTSAYKKGMVRAVQEMKKRGFREYQQLVLPIPGYTEQNWLNASFNHPIHMDRVALIYSRTYEDLKGITAQGAKVLTDKLADGMVKGAQPYEVAQEMVGAMDITRARANTISRTEIIRAHHVASINVYREAGLEGVEVQAELATVARGSLNHDALNVCTECQALEARTRKQPISLDEAEGLIPVHPNCRCVAIPRVISVKQKI